MDSESAILILKIFIEDVEDLLAQEKGKQHEGIQSEPESVLQEHLEELRASAQFHEDAQIAKSFTRACQKDAGAIAEFVSQEEQATSDHEMALRLAGMQVPSLPAPDKRVELLTNVAQWATFTPPSDSNEHIEEDDVLSVTDALSVFSLPYDSKEDSESFDQQCGSSSKYKGKEPESTIPRAPCVSCGDFVLPFDSIKLPCDPEPHTWCRQCIFGLYEASLRDEQLHPPRCCRVPIELEDIQDFLSHDLVAAFLDKTIEFSTRDRTYCSQPRCSAFIPSEKILNGIATCPACGEKTCEQCKHEAHEESDCPEDPSVQSVMQIAAAEGWRQCSRCKRMIELTQGCYHMRCLCKHQFCYLCGATWKTCPCEQFAEERLLDEAERQAAREGQADDPAAIERARAFILERHECRHDSGRARRWWARGAGGNCHICHLRWRWLLECPDCYLRCCVGCRLNRLD